TGRRRSRQVTTYKANEATERYHIHRSGKPGSRARNTAGMASTKMRTMEARSEGTVFPSAWNMLEATKITPEATKFHEMICRYSSPTATTCGSVEKMRIKAEGTRWHRRANSAIAPTALI